MDCLFLATACRRWPGHMSQDTTWGAPSLRANTACPVSANLPSRTASATWTACSVTDWTPVSPAFVMASLTLVFISFSRTWPTAVVSVTVLSLSTSPVSAPASPRMVFPTVDVEDVSFVTPCPGVGALPSDCRRELSTRRQNRGIIIVVGRTDQKCARRYGLAPLQPPLRRAG